MSAFTAGLVLVVFPAPSAKAATMTVASCDESSFDDESDLQRLIGLANDEAGHPGADTIVLQAGCTYTYSQTFQSDLPDALPAITSTVTIVGNGATIQRADDAVPQLNHLLRVTTDGNLTVRNVTLRNGVSPPPFGGAAIYNIGFTTVDGAIIRDNVHNAIFNHWLGTLTVLNSTFDNNSSQSGNGAAINAEGPLIVRGSTFTDNWTFRGGESPHNGGAIYLGTEAAALILDSVFHRNGSTEYGGAIYTSGGIASVSGCTFTENVSSGGGAVTNWTGDLTVSRSFFGSNRSYDKGAAIYGGNDLTVTNSTFWRNVADEDGGAIFGSPSGLLSITNATFAENRSLTNVGDAVRQGDSSTGTTKNSVFSGHDAACWRVRDGGNNLVFPQDSTCSGGFYSSDPHLLAPALNGGNTQTMKLGHGSFALDRALAAACPSDDQRGQPRPAGGKCDLGAFEDQVPTAPGVPVILDGGPSPSRTGAFTLGWGASSDPDGPVSYRLRHQDADDAAAGVIGTTSATAAAVTEPEGTFAYWVTALDEDHEVAGPSLTGVVVDKSAPSPPLAAADRSPDYADGGGWYRDTVTVTFSAQGDPSLADGSPGSGVASVTPALTFTPSGVHTATGTVTDHAGNVSTSTSLTVNVDSEAPTIAFSACPSFLPLDSSAEALWSASDPSSGLATPAGGAIALDTATVGQKSVGASATDNVGHTASAQCTFAVIYDFKGFFAPIANPPVINESSAGKVLALAFSLTGDRGLAVIAAGYPQSAAVPCDAFGEQTAGEATGTSPPGLTFAPSGDGRYSYPWKTSTAWRGTCRQLVLKLVDDTYHRINVRFR